VVRLHLLRLVAQTSTTCDDYLDLVDVRPILLSRVQQKPQVQRAAPEAQVLLCLSTALGHAEDYAE